jgi:peptidoglycan/LPS O-acetylase OafA/YrhL
LGGVLVVAAIALLAGEMPRPLISAGFLSPAFAAVIYGLALRPAWASFLGARFLVLLGDASYSLYLLHSFVIRRIFDAMPSLPWSLRAFLSFAAAVAASLLSFYLVEEPGRKFLRPKSQRSST